MLICQICDQPYERTAGVPSSRRFCSRDCYYASLKVPLRAIYERDQGICHICRQPVAYEEASRDHLRPRVAGGKTVWHNIALAHSRCNNARGHTPLAPDKLPQVTRDIGVMSQGN